MPYAHNGMISQSPIDGGIEITQTQYAEALRAISSGMAVTIEGGFRVVGLPEIEPPPQTPEEIEVASIRTQLAALNGSDKFRKLQREFMITDIKHFKAPQVAPIEGMSVEDWLLANKAYQALLAEDNLVDALEDRLEALGG